VDLDRYGRAVAAIDEANAEDPRRLTVRGASRPTALGEGELATEWVSRLAPGASEALLLAARAHHLRRWTVPRSSFPEGRAGYLRWRRSLYDVHAAEVAAVLAPLGYSEEEVTRVQAIVRKEDLRSDPEVQVFEDALCLVFLETEFADLAARLDEERMVEVVRKTAAKMSPAGLAAAATVPLAPRESALLARAL
jgi:hypothetical protein